MRQRQDGSVQSSATPTYQNTSRGEDDSLYRCMVTKVIYVDDPNNVTTNSTNPRVMYEVVVLGGFKAGQVISNCRLASTLGGNTSYYERVLRASSRSVSLSRLGSQDGDIVYVQFVQGNSGYPVIIALDQGITTVGKIGATSLQGPRSLSEYNGVRETINKDGEWIFQRFGGTAQAKLGAFTPASTAEVTHKIEKDEKYTRTYKSGMNIVEDGKNDKITQTLKNGINITYDGSGDKVIITTAGGAIVEVDGAGGKITLTKGSTIIELDGNGDKISLKGGFVDLGASVSDFAVLFTELLTTFNTHTHSFPYNAGPSPAVGVTQPPVAPMLQTVGSLTVKVQP